MDGRIILKCIVVKYNQRVLTGFICDKGFLGDQPCHYGVSIQVHVDVPDNLRILRCMLWIMGNIQMGHRYAIKIILFFILADKS
jgi:hypothetical protein